MPRRGENIYKRKDGRWEGRILESEGKYRYVYAKTYREVKEKQKQRKDRKSNVIQSEINRSRSQESAAELFECWLYGEIRKQVKPSTYENYSCCIQKYVIPFFKRKENECLTEFSVAQFTRSIKDYTSLSEAYKRKILTIFKTALREIAEDSSSFSPMMRAVKLPKVENREIKVFSIGEQRLIESAVFHEEDIRTLGIVLTFYTGIRLGELCALRWRDIDLDAGTMYVTKTVTRVKNVPDKATKTILLIGTPKSQKSMRKIPLPKFLLDMLMDYKKSIADEGCYLISGTKTPTDPRAYQKLYKRILERAGVKDRKFHAIRHTFATRALELGVDIKTLSEILGHSNVSITLNIYAHSLMEQKQIAMERFNELHLTRMKTTPIAVAGTAANV
jgi:Site-specific recombinase XerD